MGTIALGSNVIGGVTVNVVDTSPDALFNTLFDSGTLKVFSGDVVIPSVYKGNGVTTLGTQVF